MCGTCKYCLGFFQVAALGSAFLMITMTALFYMYGGMPPTFAMAIGFWIQYGVGWLSIYLTFYVVRVLGKGLFTCWTPTYCFFLIIAVIILYMAGAICFFVPVTNQRMTEYSRWHNRTYGRIPRFLDKFQAQYQCCGINEYRDYLDPTIFGYNITRVRRVHNGIRPTNKEWGDDQDEYLEKLKEDNPHVISRLQYFFHVPSSCCKHERRVQFKHCGDFVEYPLSDLKNNIWVGGKFKEPDPTAVIMINNASAGCFEKYQTVMGNSIFQVNWMLGILQWGSLFQCGMFFTLIWVYRLSLRAMRTNLKINQAEQNPRFSNDDEPIIVPNIENKRKSVGGTVLLDSKNKNDVVAIKPVASDLDEDESNTAMTSYVIDEKDKNVKK